MPISFIQKAGGCWGRRAIIQHFPGEKDLNLHPVNKQHPVNSTTQRINVECVTAWRVAATRTSSAEQLLTKRLLLLCSPLPLVCLPPSHLISASELGGKPLSLWQSVKSRISLCSHSRDLIIYFHYHAFYKTTHGSNLGLEFFGVENLFLAFYSLK